MEVEQSGSPDEISLETRVNKLREEGNEYFKENSNDEAINKYIEALTICSDEMNKQKAVIHSNLSLVYKTMEMNEEAIQNCTKAIELDPSFLKPLVRRAQLLEQTEKYEDCLEDCKRILSADLDPNNPYAQQCILTLPKKIEERNERLKAKMFDQLKQLGNAVLKPFGLSTDNFQISQNSEGGYSVNMKK